MSHIKQGDLATYIGEPTLVPRVKRNMDTFGYRGAAWGQLPRGAQCFVVQRHTHPGFWVVLVGENWYSIHERFLELSVSL